MALQQWAVPQISSLLGLDEESSKQIVAYTEKLSAPEATEHLTNLLGESPKSVEFITSFNTMRSIPGTVASPPVNGATDAASTNPFRNGHATSTGVSNGDGNHSHNPFSNGHDEKRQALDPVPATANGSASASGMPAPAPTPGLTTLDYPREVKNPEHAAEPIPPPPGYDAGSINGTAVEPSSTTYAPPPGPPPSSTNRSAAPTTTSDAPRHGYAPPSQPAPGSAKRAHDYPPHTNQVTEAAALRSRDEQEMQNLLQSVQMQYRIYNSDIEPEHETEYYCGCSICNYQRRKWNRLGVQDRWSKAVMYPGEKAYNDDYRMTMFVSSNPYYNGVISPYGNNNSNRWYQAGPQPHYHAANVRQTIKLNAKLNAEAQANVDGREPKISIWGDIEKDISMLKSNGDVKSSSTEKQAPSEKRTPVEKDPVEKGSSSGSYPDEKASKRQSIFRSPSSSNGKDTSSAPVVSVKTSKLGGLFKNLGVSSSNSDKGSLSNRKSTKIAKQTNSLRNDILAEEGGRWPDDEWRQLVTVYQQKIGMASKVADLRARQPLQYLHLLRAGYFEPIPVAWANQVSNPLKFSIEASSGWRGITPTWRGFEDTAEERLYWVLNHREGTFGTRLKPDFISEMNMARARMASAVAPPPEYFSPEDICHVQHTSEGYSNQVMPAPFRAFDRPEVSTDDTMILLDVSGSMDFEPVRPVYDQYMITKYVGSTQPKNKDVAKAIIRRFTDAMANHDHMFSGYDFTTFGSKAQYIGSVDHRNFDKMWSKVRIGGGTRVMTGWQKVKDLHFQKHSESATHHPIYGWQAGPQTPMLRLLLLLDGEATDMDEFELDLLGLSWAHVTIFLIGVDGCPHHHRHANELQRISDVNHHVSFVDAQGNTPERFVTHELLKRHLGYDVSMSEFQRLEELPAYER